MIDQARALTVQDEVQRRLPPGWYPLQVQIQQDYGYRSLLRINLIYDPDGSYHRFDADGYMAKGSWVEVRIELTVPPDWDWFAAALSLIDKTPRTATFDVTHFA